MEELSISISISEDEKSLLKDIFHCNNDELTMKLDKIARAATEENLRMILGQKVFTRGQDIKEYRLYLFIRYLFDGRIPDEQVITTLFQTTLTESNSLLKSVLAKYQYELKDSINETIRIILQNDVELIEEEDKYQVSNIALNIIDEMNKLLSSIDGKLNQIIRKRGSLQTFVINPSAFDALCSHFNIYQDTEE